MVDAGVRLRVLAQGFARARGGEDGAFAAAAGGRPTALGRALH
jgi:hypothetical protein